jgi:hypothetical protein
LSRIPSCSLEEIFILTKTHVVGKALQRVRAIFV